MSEKLSVTKCIKESNITGVVSSICSRYSKIVYSIYCMCVSGVSSPDDDDDDDDDELR